MLGYPKTNRSCLRPSPAWFIPAASPSFIPEWRTDDHPGPDNSWILSAGFAVGVGNNGVGAAISVNLTLDPVSAHLDNTQFTTVGSLTVHAESDDTIGAGTVGVAGSGSGNAVAGSLSVNVISNTTQAYVTANSSDTARTRHKRVKSKVAANL